MKIILYLLLSITFLSSTAACQRNNGVLIGSLADNKKIVEVLGGDAQASPLPPVLFVTNWCPACKHAEMDLNRRGVSYIRADVENNEKAQKLFMRISKRTGTRAIPQVLAGQKVFVGYSWETLAKAKNLEKRPL